jgi:hypothetical protein
MIVIDQSHIESVLKHLEVSVAHYKIQLQHLEALEVTAASKSTLRAHYQNELNKLNEFYQAIDKAGMDPTKLNFTKTK